MKINERIKYLRKTELKLTQVEFGKKIGLSGVAITHWEKGDRAIGETAIKLICKTFDVNYVWLVDGKGEIFAHTQDTLIDQLCEQYDLNDVQRRIIETVMTLTDDQINDFTMRIFGFEAIKKDQNE